MSFVPKPISLSSEPSKISEVMNINFQLLAESIKNLNDQIKEIKDASGKKTSTTATGIAAGVVLGTADQITATNSAGVTTLSTPDPFVPPGDVVLPTTGDSIKLGTGGLFDITTDSADHLQIQRTTAGGDSNVSITTNDKDGTDQVSLFLYAIGDNTATNSENLRVAYNENGVRYEINSRQTGTGSLRPIWIGHVGFQNSITVHTDGMVGINKDQATCELDVDGAIEATEGITARGGFLSTGESEPLTIAGGVITATKSYIRVDTQSAAASDDLDTITAAPAGAILVVRSVNSARSVVCKDGTGNLKLGADRTLNSTVDRLLLHSNGSQWVRMGFGNNA